MFNQKDALFFLFDYVVDRFWLFLLFQSKLES